MDTKTTAQIQTTKTHTIVLTDADLLAMREFGYIDLRIYTAAKGHALTFPSRPAPRGSR